MSDDFLLIGVDGGATEAKAHAATCDTSGDEPTFALGQQSASVVYERVAAFEPVPVAAQLESRDAPEATMTDAERAQGRVWVTAAADAISRVAQEAGQKRLLVGMGLPGLKTADGRGVSVINNGPRTPTFLADLEAELSERGLELAAPIDRLGSDADYCGLGEAHAREGLFRDVDHAYYVGGGTGVADALKLGGRLVTFDESRSWIQKSWQFSSALGPTFEKLVSAKSLNGVYESLNPSARAGFPERDALAGVPIAQAWLQTAALVLAELLFERLFTVKNGRLATAARDKAYADLATAHEHCGTVLQRLVVGQRLGELLAQDALAPWLREPLERNLASFIQLCDDVGLQAALLEDGALRPGLVQASRLRAAPALGAAVAAWRAQRGG